MAAHLTQPAGKQESPRRALATGRVCSALPPHHTVLEMPETLDFRPATGRSRTALGYAASDNCA